jgi:HEAT repeat protein
MWFVSARADALVWPDVPERIERGLSSSDATVRRAAAQELRNLGPSHGTALVERALADADVEVRLAAAQSAIRLRVMAATDIVLPWLGDHEARVRVAACDVARALPNVHALAPLARALGDPDAAVRAAAADALGSQASPEAVAPLLGKLDDASPTVRVEVARSLAHLGDPRAVVPLVGKVQDSVSEVRQAVARALGELGDLRASQALVLELRDNIDEVRIEALAALGRLRAGDAVDAIAPLAQDRKQALRQTAVATLGRIGTRDAVRVLTATLGTGDDATGGFTRTPVRDALLVVGDRVEGDLAALLRGSPTGSAAASAAWVLGELHARDRAADIVAAMRRGTLAVAPTLHALAGAGTSDSVPVVLEFADDPSPVIRDEALTASLALLDPNHPDGRAVEPLTAALRDARLTPSERAKIAMLLGRTGAPRAAPVLTGLLGAHDPVLRLTAIDALGLLGPAGADDALLQQLSDSDAAVRLHAAVALGDAGGVKARDSLVTRLDAGDELDRPALLTALGGILARAPSSQAMRRLERALELAAGPERDALIIALGRAASPAESSALTALARSQDADDRRTVATVLATHPNHAEVTRFLTSMLSDPDADVRAEAAWGLGEVGSAPEIGALEALATSVDVSVAADAAAAIGRIAARVHASTLATRALCPRLSDRRPLVRANALTGLGLAGARCGDGAVERSMLANDVDVVRAAAALAVTRPKPTPEDTKALERCAANDRSGAVALRCRSAAPPRPVAAMHAVEVYVVRDVTGGPRPRADYALEFADGLLRAGRADRRGAVFDPAAPAGSLELRRIPSLSPL